ncbi:MAG: hypothetical protein JWL95_2685 [Gemmatimonadetes bacterium]|nr:hypothetical protein [Gemmatimonadota bacterium]
MTPMRQLIHERLATYALLSAITLGAMLPARAHGQAVVEAWGNVLGIRVEGEVIPFETSLCTVNAVGTVVARTQKERQRPSYGRTGRRRTIGTRLGAFSMTEVVEDVRPGEITLDVRFTADSASDLRGFLCVDVPSALYASPRVIDSARTDAPTIEPVRSPAALSLAHGAGRGFTLAGAPRASRRRISIASSATSQLFMGTDSHDGQGVYRIFIPILTGHSEPGRSVQTTFTVTASGVVDHSPIALTMDASRPGRVFDGLGGNFRIQNPRVDPAVIAYNLANLRVAWARVEMPWRSWDPDTTVDPAARDTAR